MRGIKCFLSLLALILIFSAACSPADSIPPGAIADGLGRPVNIEKIPQRIISLVPSNTEVLFTLGLGDKVVGVTEYCNYPPEALGKEKIGGFSTPDIELMPI
ncbi:Vitamin B12-binding protein [subsurface metagenome]